MQRTSTDLLRLLAMTVVVLIHATAGCEWVIARGGDWWSWDGLGVVINQGARFCVPLFVCLSGYGLAARHLAGRRETWPAFMAGRLGRIALPYVALSVVVLACQDWRGGLLPTLEALARGQADYHLYFIPLILSCYLLFPLLVQRDSRVLWWTFLIVLLAFASPAHRLWETIGLRFPGLDGWSPHVWLFWFYHGIRLAHADRRGDPAPGRWTLALALVAGVAVIAEFAWWVWPQPGAQPNPGWFDHFQRWVVVAYGLAFLAAWRAWRVGANLPAAPVALLSALSFPVFLAHTAVLRLVLEYITTWPLSAGCITLGLTTAGVWILHVTVPGRWPRRLLGLGDGAPVAVSPRV